MPFPSLIRSFGLVAALSAIAAGQLAAQPDDQDKRFEIPRHDGAGVVVDGVLDEAVWQRAALVEDLHQIDPFEFAEPSQPTEIRLFYDDDMLYVAARMWDSEADTKHRLTLWTAVIESAR